MGPSFTLCLGGGVGGDGKMGALFVMVPEGTRKMSGWRSAFELLGGRWEDGDPF